MVRDKSPHSHLFPEFQGASYVKRYDILCQRLIQEQLYTTAAVIATPRTAASTGDYVDLSEMTSLKTFVASLGERRGGGGQDQAHKRFNVVIPTDDGGEISSCDGRRAYARNCPSRA